jgi:Fatty acid desaturase
MFACGDDDRSADSFVRAFLVSGLLMPWNLTGATHPAFGHPLPRGGGEGRGEANLQGTNAQTLSGKSLCTDVPGAVSTGGILRHSSRDALLVWLAFLHGLVLAAHPAFPIIALGLWWNANTVSHNFIHLPFFRSRRLNAIFSAWESLVLGFPQRLWRDRHLAHHADRPWKWRPSCPLLIETALVAGLWLVLALIWPTFFFGRYLPGWLLGLGLCQLQGTFEHARGTTSHYGRLYNALFFNDGYHTEHHEHPGEHWTGLPARRRGRAQSSRWPAALRWLEWIGLDGLERLVFRSKWLQRFVIDRHERAWRALLPHLKGSRRVGIVGGGLFPRTALILQWLLPEAQLTVVDANADHLRLAGRFLNGKVTFAHEMFDPAAQTGFDLVVIPLAFIGDRSAVYRQPPARLVVVHDWLWRRQGLSVLVSRVLLKRLNLIKR